MKFHHDSDEEACSKLVMHGHVECGCMRTADHTGPCEALMCDAGRADGVCWECRAAIGTEHKDWCDNVLSKASKIVVYPENDE